MRFRWTIIAISLIVSCYMLFHPPADGEGGWGTPRQNFWHNIKLGLDLQGGIFMQLEVDELDAVRQYLEEQSGIIKSNLEGEEFTIQSSDSNFDNRSVTLYGVSHAEKDVRAEIKDLYGHSWTVSKSGDDIELELRDIYEKQVKDDAVTQTVYKIQNRIDELGVTEPVINRTIGSNRIVLELAGADDSQRVHKIVREPGKLEWRLVVPTNARNERIDGGFPTEEALMAALGGNVPPGTRVFEYADERRGTKSYLLLKEVMMTAKNVAEVSASQDDRGLPAVGIVLDRDGGQTMARESSQNVGNRLAIVLDGKVVSAPTIQSRLSERFIITGLQQGEVPDLIVKIKSGSLPAQVNILEERVIGPTLGRDAIRSGSMAAGLGLIVVVIFILAYYRLAGFFAFIALALNLLLILGMLSVIGAVLTLPGIAGFILTIGMAVDANVLVFERIREELREGIMPKNAIEVGYKSAFITIMDANITTFIAAFFLYLLGEGPVKGFAVMLMIGIVCSIFTAVFCSRTFFLQAMNRDVSRRELSIWPIWKSNAVTS